MVVKSIDKEIGTFTVVIERWADYGTQMMKTALRLLHLIIDRMQDRCTCPTAPSVQMEKAATWLRFKMNMPFFLYPQMKQEREGGTEANRRQRKRKRENGNGGEKLKDETESIAMVTW